MELIRIIYLFIYLVITSLSSITETTNLTQHLPDFRVHNLFTNEIQIIRFIKPLNELFRHVSVHLYRLQEEHNAYS